MNKYEEVLANLNQEPRKWLITGVAGFIGSNLLETLLINNQKVIGLDNFSTGHQHNLDQVQDIVSPQQWNNFQFIQGDIRNPETCQTDHPDLPKVEDKIGNPLSPYAVTKLANELYTKVFARTYGFNTIGLRYFNIFGQRRDPKGAYAAVIPKWVASLLSGDEVFINGDGETSRDFCYIRNVMQMNILAATADNPEAANQVYNVALNHRTSLTEQFQFIYEKLKSRVPDMPDNRPVYRDFRAGDVRHSQADII